MRNGIALASILLLGLGACGDDGGGGDGNGTPDATSNLADAAAIIDAAPPAPDAQVTPLPDAAPSALDCAGDPLPDTVTDPPVTIMGSLLEASISGGIGPMESAAVVAANNVSDDSNIDTGTFTGSYSLSGPLSDTPLDAYLQITSGGYVDTYVYPPAPLAESLDGTPVIMFQSNLIGLIGLLTGGVNQQAGNGMVVGAAVDCETSGIDGATISVEDEQGNPVGDLFYGGDNGLPDTGATRTSTRGIAYILNVPPGDYTLKASVGGVDLRDNEIKVYADSNTTAVIAP